MPGKMPGKARKHVVSGAMPTSLHSSLQDLAHKFASDVLGAIRSASLGDLRAESGGTSAPRGPGRPRGSTTKTPSKASRATVALKPGKPSSRLPRLDRSVRLPRRSSQDIAKTLDQVVALVKKSKTGLRSEEIRQALALDVREVPRVLKQGLTSKKLKSKGQKRATRYSAA
jgi:hypothetical protein